MVSIGLMRAPQLDYGQLKLVFEALRERTSVLKNAPHLSNSLPTLMPCYELWEVRVRPTHSQVPLRSHKKIFS